MLRSKLKFGFLCFLLTASFAASAQDIDAGPPLQVLDEEHPLHVNAGTLVTAEGDSLTYGLDVTSGDKQNTQINGSHFTRSITPYPETLAIDLKHKIKIENLGFPGDRTSDGLKRWQNAVPGNLVLLMYGSNDAVNYGHYPDGTIDIDTFKKNLFDLVKRRQSAGATVVIMTPPTVQDKNQEKLITPYRVAAAEVAQNSGAYLFDTVAALDSFGKPWTDGVHLKPEAYAAIAAALAADIKVD